MKILLTGGTGFIGSYVVIELLKGGHDITIIARNPELVSTFTKDERIKFIKGELSDHDVLRKAVEGMDAVCHIALGWGDEAENMLLNDTLPSIILMESAANAGVKQFLYTSSTAAMGEGRPLMGTEMKTRPIDFYGATKASTENYLLSFAHQSKMRCNILRPGYTYGNPVVEGARTQADKRFIDIAQNAAKGLPIELTKHDGTQFIHAGDLAKVYRSILESDSNKEIYHGLGAVFSTWESIAKTAIELTNSKSELTINDLGWDAEPHLFDVSKLNDKWEYFFDGNLKIAGHLQHYIDLL